MAFGGTIKLQGEKEYRDALRKITDNLKLVGTELAKVSSQYGKNESSVGSLTSKNEVLTQKLDEQKRALDLTRDMLEKAKSEYDKSVQSVSELKDELSKAEAALDSARDSTDTTADEIATLEENVKELKDKLAAAETETGNYETTVKKWTSEVNRAETAVNNTTREINDNKAAIDKLNGATDDAADNVDDLADSMDDAADKTDDFSDNLGDLKGATEKAGDGFTVFKGVLTNLVSNGINFVMDGLHDLMGEAINASDTMAKFEQTMGFAGFDETQIQKAADEVKDYADKTVYNLDTIANTTAQLAANGITDFTGLTEAAGNLNAVAGGNADTFQSVATAITQTAGAGKLTTENWNQLADAIPGASGKLQEALRNAGAYTGDFRDAMSKGQITADEFNQAIMTLGNEPVAVEAATSVATFEGAVGNLQATVVSGLQEIIEEIGMENLTGFLSDATDLVGKLLTKTLSIVKWVKNNLPTVMILVTGLLTAYTAQLIANTGAAIAAAAAEKGLTVWQYAVAKAQVTLNNVMAANPIGLVIAGITALVAGFVYLWNNCEDFREFWIDLWEGIKPAVSDFIENFQVGWQMLTDYLNPAIESIVGFFTSAWENIQVGWGVAIDFFKGIWEGIKDTFSAVAETLGAFFKAAWEGIKGIWNVVVGFFQGIWNGIVSAFSSASTWFTNLFQSAWNGIKDIWNAAGSFFAGIWASITNAFSNVSTWFARVFSQAWTAIKNVFSTVGDFFGGIWDTIKSKFTDIGTKVGDAIGGAFKTAINAVISTVEGAINAIPNAINGAISAINELPGVNISKMSAVSLPRLAKGGVVSSSTIANIGEDGAEAIVPLEKNTGWIRRIAEELQRNFNSISLSPSQTQYNAAGSLDNDLAYTFIVSAFKDALKGVTVEMDDDTFGKFVEKTVADAIYT